MPRLLSGTVDLKFVPEDSGRLTRQIYDRLRTAILSGALPPGYRLPSSRMLAKDFNVSRNTVSAVVDQLAVEGYVVVERGRRPVVAAVEKMQLIAADAGRRQESSPPRISRWASLITKADWHFINDGRPRPFAPGLADAREFPHEVWARCLRRAAGARAQSGVIGVNHPALRAALLGHLVAHRGVKAGARQLIITSSAQAAIELICRVILNAGDLAWIESPGYGGADVALRAAGAIVCAIPLDEQGMTVASRKRAPRLIFITPSHQYPTGRLMPIGRRLEWLRFAEAAGASIIEDDYDGEFHYEARPVAALQGLAASPRVLYLGTFSKATYADIRFGYIVVPEALVDTFELAQRHTGMLTSIAMQDALAEFIGSGAYLGHIRRVTRLYKGRRDRMLQALASEAGDRLAIEAPAGGMQLLARCQASDQELSARLLKAGVVSRPLSNMFYHRSREQGLFLGFAAWNENEIDQAARILGRIVR